jgi:hypothetical protein
MVGITILQKISFLLLFIEMRMEEHTQQFFPNMIA